MPDARSSDAPSNAPRASAIPRLLKPRWRRMLVAGWVLFAVSFLFPALSRLPDRYRIPVPPPPLPPAASPIIPEAGAVSGSGVLLMAQGNDITPGWEAFLYALFGWGGILGIASALNLLMVATAFHGKWSARARWPVIVLAAAAVFNLGYWLWWVADDGAAALEIGYYAWVASFACAAVAFRLRWRRGGTSLAE